MLNGDGNKNGKKSIGLMSKKTTTLHVEHIFLYITLHQQTFRHCLDFDEVSAILQALHICAMLPRSSGEVKFDGSLCMLKPVYFAFVKTMLQCFLQTTHFVKSLA